MSVDEIEKAITKLSAKDCARIRAWFEDMDQQGWDRQIERDAKSGKLDKLFENALTDLRAGRVKKL